MGSTRWSSSPRDLTIGIPLPRIERGPDFDQEAKCSNTTIRSSNRAIS